jgi:[acyl-carrier-protein] S-malonyltransferase
VTVLGEGVNLICFVFPGQGSQREKMGEAWTDHPSWELVEEASQVANRDLGHLLLSADPAELSMTRNTQISTFLMSMIALDSIERLGISPQICAGHSLGEYSALVGAGAMTFDAAVKLVAERGEAMQLAAEENPGAMAAVLGASDESVLSLCDAVGEGVFIANYNSDGQTVVAGTIEAIDRLIALHKDFGIKRVIKIPVGGGFHTPLINSAQPRLKKALGATRFYDSDIPVISNVDAREHSKASEWPELLLEQLCSPVLWKQSMELLRKSSPKLVVEVGPGGVLTGLFKRSMPEVTALSVSKPEDLEFLIEQVADQGPLHEWATYHHGERFYSSERLVVADCAGVFSPDPELVKTGQGATILVGQRVGSIGSRDVRSPFSGKLQSMIAVEGERVTTGQPIAWLQSEEM